MVKLKMIKGKFLRGEEYQTKFDSKVFLKSCYNSPEESNELMKFAFKTHKEIFSSGKKIFNLNVILFHKVAFYILQHISTRVVRKVLRLCLYLKKYPSLENKTYTIFLSMYAK